MTRQAQKTGYIHTCPECHKDFRGRQNQIYHPACKVIYNNRMAKEKRQMLNLAFKPLTANELILEKHYDSSQANDGIPQDLLIKTGFDPTRFSEIVFTRKEKIQYFVISSYAWTNERKSGYIHIEKKLLLKARDL